MVAAALDHRDEVVLEVTFANKPCHNLKPLFKRLKAAGKISAACPEITSSTKGPLEPRGGPGQRGWFARVVQEGEIRAGDEIFAEAPDGPPAKKQRKTSSFFAIAFHAFATASEEEASRAKASRG